MNETQKISIIVTPICWVIGLIVGLVLYFTVSSVWALSFALGLLTALMNLSFTVRGSKKMLDEIEREELGRPVRKNMMYFAFRLILFILVFGVVINDQFVSNVSDPKFNVWATLIGYSVVKIVLIIVSLIKKGRVNKNDNVE